MNSRTLIMLGVVTVVAVGFAAMTSKGPGRNDAKAAVGQRLFPTLLDSINDVTSLKIESPDGAITITKKSDSWGLAEKHDYPVNLDKFAACLKGIALVETIEAKTKEPNRYSALGVEGSGEGSASTVFTLGGQGGNVLAALIVGNRRAGQAGGDSHYVRVVDDEQSWLAEGQFDTQVDSSNWIDKQIAKIERARIQAVLIEHVDGEALKISKPDAAAATFTVHDLPEGRELSYPTVADGMANTLEWLNLDDVSPSAEIELGDDWSTKSTFWTFDGLKIEATLTPKDGATWARLVASYDEAGAPFVEAPAEGTEVTEPVTDRAAVDAEIAALNERLSVWTYKLPAHSLSSLAKRMEQLLKPLPVEPVEGEGSVDNDPMEGVEIQDLLSPEQIEEINREHGTDIPVTRDNEDGQ